MEKQFTLSLSDKNTNILMLALSYYDQKSMELYGENQKMGQKVAANQNWQASLDAQDCLREIELQVQKQVD